MSGMIISVPTMSMNAVIISTTSLPMLDAGRWRLDAWGYVEMVRGAAEWRCRNEARAVRSYKSITPSGRFDPADLARGRSRERGTSGTSTPTSGEDQSEEPTESDRI